jgi:hypothetical protein
MVFIEHCLEVTYMRKSLFWSVYAVVILTAIAALAGILSYGSYGGTFFTSIHGEEVELFARGIYRRDSVSVALQAIAQDAVTLFLALPIYLVSCWKARRTGSQRARLWALGLTGYLLYAYMSYAFLSYVNELFLVYTTIVSLTFFQFTFGLIDLWRETDGDLPDELPLRGVRIYLGVSVVGIALLWLGRIAPTFAGDPATGIEHYHALPIQVFDFAFLLPAAGYLVWNVSRQRPFLSLLSFVFVLKVTALLVSIVAMMGMMAIGGEAPAWVEFVVFPGLTLVSIALLWRYHQALRTSDKMTPQAKTTEVL